MKQTTGQAATAISYLLDSYLPYYRAARMVTDGEGSFTIPAKRDPKGHISRAFLCCGLGVVGLVLLSASWLLTGNVTSSCVSEVAKQTSHQRLAADSLARADSFGTGVATPKWTRLADAPLAVQEGTFVVIGKELWVMSGLPFIYRVYIYNSDTNQWRNGPKLPFAVHHNSYSGFVSSNGTLVMFGGIKITCKFEGDQWDLKKDCAEPNNDLLIYHLPSHYTSNCEDDEFTIIPGAGYGGITHCTQLALEGLRYCYAEEKGVFIENRDHRSRFFTIGEIDLSVNLDLPLPPYERNHVSMLLDKNKRVVHMSGGRINYYEEGILQATTTSIFDTYDIDSQSWASRTLESPFETVEARMTIQVPNKPCVLFAGGQKVIHTKGLGLTSDIILQLCLPNLEWSYVGEMPIGLFGINGQIIMDGGMATNKLVIGPAGTRVGVNPWRRTYLWDIGSLLDVQAHSMPFLSRRQVTVISALCGSYSVTDEVVAYLSNPLNMGNIYGTFCDSVLVPRDLTGGPIRSHLILPVLSIVYARHRQIFHSVCNEDQACVVDAEVVDRTSYHTAAEGAGKGMETGDLAASMVAVSR